MAGTVARVSEISSTSATSFEDAVAVGVARANSTLRNVRSAWVKGMQVNLDDSGQINEYLVKLKVTFVLDD